MIFELGIPTAVILGRTGAIASVNAYEGAKRSAINAQKSIESGNMTAARLQAMRSNYLKLSGHILSGFGLGGSIGNFSQMVTTSIYGFEKEKLRASKLKPFGTNKERGEVTYRRPLGFARKIAAASIMVGTLPWLGFPAGLLTLYWGSGAVADLANMSLNLRQSRLMKTEDNKPNFLKKYLTGGASDIPEIVFPRSNKDEQSSGLPTTQNGQVEGGA